jgi:hypothetical protein
MPKPLMSVGDLEKRSAEFVEELTILEPRLPAPLVAERIVSEADPEFLGELARALHLAYFTRLARIQHAKQRRALNPPLPGFEHLPRRIPGYRGKLVDTLRAGPGPVRRYAARLRRQFARRGRERADTDTRVIEATKLYERMAEYGMALQKRKRQGKVRRVRFNVADVLGLEVPEK